MKFWRDKSLKVWGIYLLVIVALLFVVEYFAVRYSINKLNEAERKIDYARSVQVKSQQIALQTQQYLSGKKDVAAPLAAALDEQEHSLKLLSKGGRIDGTELFLTPLGRLPRITYDNLYSRWAKYSGAITALINESETTVETTPAQPDSLGATPAVQVLLVQNQRYAKAQTTFEAQWLSIGSWYDRLIKDLEDEIDGRQRAVLNWFAFFMVLNLGSLGLVYAAFNRKVLQPLKALEQNTAGHIQSDAYDKNEIGQVANRINNTLENLKDATDFVTAIGEGKLDMDYKQTLDEHYTAGQNRLADSLIEMQSRLKTLNEEERKRQWANEGLTKFVDILRSSNDNLTTLGDSIIAALVRYTRSNQGAIYILNDEDEYNKHLELMSLFAFDIKKHEQRKIKLGEGILGQTFLERETTYLDTVPDEYIRITSGLGDANPRAVLMVPLKVDTNVYGIIELASFNTFLPHEITFVEKLSESIASTLAQARASQQNRHLIEQFKEQTEQMRAQEEEMRQNMEEMQATQEEVSRKEKSYVARIKELEEQLRNPKPSAEAAKLREDLTRKEREYQEKIESLTQQLAQPRRADDWAVAEAVEKDLKTALQALQITQEALEKKLKP